MEPLERLKADDERIDAAIAVWRAKGKLNEFLTSSVFSSEIRSCRQLGQALLQTLNEFNDKDLEKNIQAHEAWIIKNSHEKFKIAFLAELGIVPSYFVTRKGSFDTLSILDTPLCLYPIEIVTKVPEAVYDVIEAGKALAFDLPTACGFHVFRVTESVLRRYYMEVTKATVAPKVRNIAVYINSMRQNKCGDEKILSALKQMSDLHRNPLIHPDSALSTEEAIATLGMSRSVVASMLSALPEVPQTTTNVSPFQS